MPLSHEPMTEADYLTFERESEIKHMLLDGEIYAMTGASREHNLIVTNTLAALHAQLRDRDCEMYPSDMKVRTAATASYVYPDISIVCGQPHFSDERGDTLLNPTVVIEVLSPSTEAFDRGLKFQRYREIESLVGYLLIAQERPQLDYFMRGKNGVWQLQDVAGLESVLTLAAIDVQLSLTDVYAKIDFQSPRDNSTFEE